MSKIYEFIENQKNSQPVINYLLGNAKPRTQLIEISKINLIDPFCKLTQPQQELLCNTLAYYFQKPELLEAAYRSALESLISFNESLRLQAREEIKQILEPEPAGNILENELQKELRDRNETMDSLNAIAQKLKNMEENKYSGFTFAGQKLTEVEPPFPIHKA